MVHWWCSANLELWRTSGEVRAMRKSFFYNMVCYFITSVCGSLYLPRLPFALTVIFIVGDEGDAVK